MFPIENGIQSTYGSNTEKAKFFVYPFNFIWHTDYLKTDKSTYADDRSSDEHLKCFCCKICLDKGYKNKCIHTC